MPRDCFFVVADKNIEFAIRGLLEREAFHRSLECAPFGFEARHDLIVAGGANDPGLYRRAHEYVAPPRSTHQHLVVVLDAEWQGSPGPEAIRHGITEACARAGWHPDDSCVAVIAPELENWVWQDNPNVDRILGHRRPPTLRDHLAGERWPREALKPPQPKATLEFVLRQNRIPRSSSLYREIAARVSVANCIDPAFIVLRNSLRRWFPAELLPAG